MRKTMNCNFMKTTPEFEHLAPQRFRPNRRRGWKRKMGIWLWVLVVALLLVLVGAARAERPRSARNEEWRMRNDEFVLPHSGFDIPAKRAGFGASDTLAVVIVLGVCVALLVRLWWGARAQAEEEECDVEHLRGCIDEDATAEALRLWGSCPVARVMSERPFMVGPLESLNEPLNADEGVRAPRGVDWTNGARTKAWDDDPLQADEGVRASWEMMPEGLPRAMVWEIVNAMAEEVRIIRGLLSGAMRTLSVDDYFDALHGAEKRLAQLRVTLCELRERFADEAAPSITDRLKPLPAVLRSALQAGGLQARNDDLCGWGDLRPVPSTIISQPSTTAKEGEA
jgi:hypothetical protein